MPMLMKFLPYVNKKFIILKEHFNLFLMKGPTVDPVKCIGCGLCVQLVPNVFAMQDDGKSKVVKADGDEQQSIQGAVDACPVTAISWKEYEESGETPEAASEEGEEPEEKAA